MKSKQPRDLKALPGQLLGRLEPLKRYSLLIFIVLVMGLYSFVLLRIHSLSMAEPSADAVSSQLQAAHVIHVDKAVVKQLQSLQDNSVNVQALFDQARSNPFQ
jgi:Flp pilus assembly protein CpaB